MIQILEDHKQEKVQLIETMQSMQKTNSMQQEFISSLLAGKKVGTEASVEDEYTTPEQSPKFFKKPNSSKPRDEKKLSNNRHHTSLFKARTSQSSSVNQKNNVTQSLRK